MVVICLEPTEPTGTWHDRVATPSICTVQAPHWAMPQPYLVPVSPIVSRNTQSNGVSASTSTLWVLPLIESAIMLAFLHQHRDQADRTAAEIGVTRKGKSRAQG